MPTPNDTRMTALFTAQVQAGWLSSADHDKKLAQYNRTFWISNEPKVRTSCHKSAAESCALFARYLRIVCGSKLRQGAWCSDVMLSCLAAP